MPSLLILTRPIRCTVEDASVLCHAIIPATSEKDTTYSIESAVALLIRYEEASCAPLANIGFYRVVILNTDYSVLESFNWQSTVGSWRCMDDVVQRGQTVSVTGLNLQSVLKDTFITLTGNSIIRNAENDQRRIIYTGYWLSNDTLPSIVNDWVENNVTHVLLTFITLEGQGGTLTGQNYMLGAFVNLSSANQQLLLDSIPFVGVSIGGATGADFFATPNPYYYPPNGTSNPVQFVEDLYNLVIFTDTGAQVTPIPMLNYIDFDIEHIPSDVDVDDYVQFWDRLLIKYTAFHYQNRHIYITYVRLQFTCIQMYNSKNEDPRVIDIIFGNPLTH